MCDYSLMHAKSRPAVVGEQLVTKNFGTGTRGFCNESDPSVAVCLLPGTELGFGAPVKSHMRTLFERIFGQRKSAFEKIATFRQIDKDDRLTHHDALEFSNGEIVKVTNLIEGQRATVLQLPAAPKSEAEANEQKRLEVIA